MPRMTVVAGTETDEVDLLDRDLVGLHNPHQRLVAEIARVAPVGDEPRRLAATVPPGSSSGGRLTGKVRPSLTSAMLF
jgi:hypothetical protein